MIRLATVIVLCFTIFVQPIWGAFAMQLIDREAAEAIANAKIAALKKAGVEVSLSPAEMGIAIQKAIKNRK